MKDNVQPPTWLTSQDRRTSPSSVVARLSEAKKVNTSLLALSSVIAALTANEQAGQEHIRRSHSDTAIHGLQVQHGRTGSSSPLQRWQWSFGIHPRHRRQSTQCGSAGACDCRHHAPAVRFAAVC